MRNQLGRGAINLAGSTFKMSLFTGATNAADLTRQVIGELTGEVANANGYGAGGKTMTGIQWIVSATPDEMRFTSDTITWTAAGGPISNVQYAVIWMSTGVPSTSFLICVASLEENGQFSVSAGNPLNVAPAPVGGIFELQ